jgi:uncharacterized protein YjbI with pentapeptide repeats
MPQAPKRDPRPPQLTLSLERPEAAGQVFLGQARHEGLLVEGAAHPAVVAEEVRLEEFALDEVDLSEAKLDHLELTDGSIKGCNLANLESQSCMFNRVVVESTRLTGATLIEPRLMDVRFRDCPLDLSSFRFGRLHRVRFERCRLNEADFQGVTAEACSFIDCDMTGAQLSQGNFAGSAFRGCRLSAVRGPAALKGAQMAWEDVLELATSMATSLGIEIRDDLA